MEKNYHIPDYIRGLPLQILQRLRLEKIYHYIAKPINGVLGRRDYGKIFFQPLVYSNSYYGNEYVLRRYAEIKKDLFAIIEHGLFLGNNTRKVGLEHEWDLGCILTYGNYR